MKLSNTGMGTTKLNNIDEMYPGQSILLQTGQLVQYGAGLFAYNTVPLLVRRNVEKIITETLNKYNCIEVLLPTLQPDTIWKNSGRYDTYVNNGTMLITESNKGVFCLAPTGEEAMLEFAREKLKSYKNLPATFYQIGEKCRNEIRTRGYLLRGKSFPMLDAYSFDIDEEKDINTNVVILNAYLKAMGVRLTFSDQYYTINSYDDNEILDYEDEETGEIVVDTEAGIDRYQIRKKIDDYYTNGIGTYIGTEENYEKLLDMEVENYIAARDDEPLPYPDIENTFDGFE